MERWKDKKDKNVHIFRVSSSAPVCMGIFSLSAIIRFITMTIFKQKGIAIKFK